MVRQQAEIQNGLVVDTRTASAECEMAIFAESGPTGCALAAPPPIDGNHIVADTDAEKGTISLDAKRRPLQARVGREH